MRILLAFFALFISYQLLAEDIHSSPFGGKWNEYKTWTNGKIPTKDDNVILTSDVYITSAVTCKNIHILKTGGLILKKIDKGFKVNILEQIKMDGGTLKVDDDCIIEIPDLCRTGDALVQNNGTMIIGK